MNRKSKHGIIKRSSVLYLALAFLFMTWLFQPLSSLIYLVFHRGVPASVWKTLTIISYVCYILTGPSTFKPKAVALIFFMYLSIIISLTLRLFFLDTGTFLIESLSYYIGLLTISGIFAGVGFPVKYRYVLIERYLFNSLTIIAIPLYSIGVAQFVTQKPLFIETTLLSLGIDINSAIKIWEFFGRTRAFSLFLSTGYFVMFINLLFLISVSMLLVSENFRAKIKALVITIISGVVLYMTQTRVGYVQLLVGTITVGLLYYSRKHRWLGVGRIIGVVLIVSIGIIMITLYMAMNEPAQIEERPDLLNPASLQIRTSNWDKILNSISINQFNFWFGNLLFSNNIMIGLGQISKYADPDSIIVDNGYMALFMFGGLLFTIITTFAMIISSYKILGLARDIWSPVAIGFAAYITSIVLANFYGSFWDQFALGVAGFFAIYDWSKSSTIPRIPRERLSFERATEESSTTVHTSHGRLSVEGTRERSFPGGHGGDPRGRALRKKDNWWLL